MKKFVAGIIIAICSSGHTLAQHISVVTANKQSWSGGVAGHWGINYSFTVKMDKDVTLDSLYVSYLGEKLVLGKPGQGNVIKDSVNHVYIFSAGESHFDNSNGGPMQPKDDSPKPLRHITTTALITYYYKGEKRLLPVKELQSLPSLNYP
jgi:hypothetical protein